MRCLAHLEHLADGVHADNNHDAAYACSVMAIDYYFVLFNGVLLVATVHYHVHPKRCFIPQSMRLKNLPHVIFGDVVFRWW